MADEKIYTNIGHVTAYAYAKSKGYTGTEEQFATEQANFAANAQQVREDKESVEATVATFDNTTVPAAVQTVTAEGTRQVGIVGTAGDTQVARVQAEGTTQVGVVQTEGTTQKNAVQAKGNEVIASIPSDYTELTEEVEDLKSSIADTTDYALNAYATDTASGAIATLPDGADGIPIKSLSVAIEPVQAGSGDPSPDNIRPISGHTECNIARTGINVWDEEWEIGEILSTTGQNSDSTDVWRSKNYIPVYPGTQYYVYGSSSGKQIRPRFYDASKNYIGYTCKSGNANTGTDFTTPDNAYYMRFAPRNSEISDHIISLNYPYTDNGYHSGKGNVTYPITFPSGTGTVYGGTLDVTNGVLTVDMASVDLGTLEWTYNSGQLSMISNSLGSNVGDGQHIKCSIYKVAPSLQGGALSSNDKCIAFNKASTTATGNFTSGVLVVKDTAYSDAATFKTAMSGVQLVYELATPITIPLTAPQITTLLGTNNVWSDTGDVSVIYRANTAMYISKKIAEALNA